MAELINISKVTEAQKKMEAEIFEWNKFIQKLNTLKPQLRDDVIEEIGIIIIQKIQSTKYFDDVLN